MLSSGRFLSALVIAWMITPFLFILIGLVCESRLVPLWRDQSRAFMPGDLALGIVLACGWYLFPQVSETSVWRETPFPLFGTLAVGGVLCYVMRKWFDGPGYDPRALRSPTKMYHDFVLYVFYAAALIYLCVPSVLTSTSWSEGNLGPKLLALTALGVWVVGLVADGLNRNMPTPRMHVALWKPVVSWSKIQLLAFRFRRMI